MCLRVRRGGGGCHRGRRPAECSVVADLSLVGEPVRLIVQSVLWSFDDAVVSVFGDRHVDPVFAWWLVVRWEERFAVR